MAWDDLKAYLARPEVQAEIAADEARWKAQRAAERGEAPPLPAAPALAGGGDEVELIEPPGGQEGFEERRAALRANWAAATAAAPERPGHGPPAPPPGWDGPKFELGRLLGSGIEILRWGAEVGVFTAGRPPAAFHRYAEMAGLMTEGDDWHAAARDDWMEYREFYYEQDKVIMAPMEIVRPKDRAKWLASRPEPTTIEKGGLAISLAGIGYEAHTLFFGPTNVGKSRAAIWAAMESGLTTLYVATEQLEGGATWMEGIGGGDDIIFTSTPRDHREVNELAALADEEGVELVVVDTIAQLVADENSASDYVSMLRYLAPLTEGRQALFVHHTGKNEALGPRGISKMVDTPPIIYRVARGDHHNEIIIANYKLKTPWEGLGGVLAVSPPTERSGRWGVEASPPKSGRPDLPLEAIESNWRDAVGSPDEPLSWSRIRDEVVAPAVKDVPGATAAAAMRSMKAEGHLVAAPRPKGRSGDYYTLDAPNGGGARWRNPSRH